MPEMPAPTKPRYDLAGAGIDRQWQSRNPRSIAPYLAEGCMRVATWNTQGSFLEGAKQAIVREIHAGTNVLFLQEGGVEKVWSDGLFHTVQGQSVGAKNERCTNYILVNQTFWNVNATQISFDSVGGGIAGRKPAAIQIGDTIFVSWHSISASDNSDTSQLLRECEQKLGSQGVNNIIIGGDFNTDPANIEAMVVMMAAGRGGGGFYSVVCHTPTDMPTHNSGRVLDFFVIMTNGNMPSGKVWVAAVEPSDHDPVFMDVS
jgi:endonuclease/exonuclease/phosphatase family metal-dependent hydrolase